MRTAAKLMLTGVALIVAIALTATSAAAQVEDVEVINEGTRDHCSGAIANCEVHAVTADPSNAPTTIVGHNVIGEFIISECAEELLASFNEDGSGHAFLTSNSHATDPDCTTEQCAEGAEREWPITDTAETSPGAGLFTLTFCLFSEVTGADFHCTVQVDFDETATEHQYELRAVDDGCLGAGQTDNEVTGHWLTEVDPENFDEVEVIHQ